MSNEGHFCTENTSDSQKEYLEKLINENKSDTEYYYDTKSVLLSALEYLTSDNAPLPQYHTHFIYHLSKEFNLFGKFYTKYDSELKPLSDKFDCIITCALLIIFSTQYKFCRFLSSTCWSQPAQQ